MNDAYIVSGARTPQGRFLGSLATQSAPQLGAAAIRAALERSGLRHTDIDEVIMGNVISAGMGQAPARQAALAAGFPNTIAALTINKVCGSGLKAVMLAAQAVRAADAQAIVAGGMESMSQAPHVVGRIRMGHKLGDLPLKDAMVHDGLTCAFELCHMGMHAEHTATVHQISRADQDAFAAQSQRRATDAIENHFFDDEITPVTVRSRKGDTVMTEDQCPRRETTLESLAKLPPVFQSDGTVTAGNSSALSDGAAALVVTDKETASKSIGVSRDRLCAKILAYHTSGTAPQDLFLAPVNAINAALAKANLTTSDIDLFEINEAFASQMLACIRKLDIAEDQVNIYGGGISLGHPIGASGARAMVTLLYTLRRRHLKRGVVSLCLGGGNAVAMVVEQTKP